MSQQSEERLTESDSADPNDAPGARILHLKARQYDLRKAIQQRAQESVEREAKLDEEQRRPKPLKWMIALAIAAIPVLLTLTAVDGFLRAFHKYLGVAVESAERQAAEAAAAAPPEEISQPSEPGVVMLSPMAVSEQQPAAPPARDSAQPPPNQ